MLSNLPRIAQLLPRIPTTQAETAALINAQKFNYQPPPQILVDRLEQAAAKMGVNVVVKPELQGSGTSGQMYGDGTLALSPALKKAKGKVLAHELGHWEMKHHDQPDLPIWVKELEAEAIAANVLGRLHSEATDQHAKFAAAYIGGQIGAVNSGDELLARQDALSKASDWIIQNMIPENIKSRSAYAARMVKSPPMEASVQNTGYDGLERYQMYSGGAS